MGKERQKPNIKRLFWYKGVVSTDLQHLTGLTYTKLMRILNNRDLEEVKYSDLSIIAKALGMKGVDELIQKSIEANDYDRTERMDQIFKVCIRHQKDYGRMQEGDIEDVMRENHCVQKYKKSGTEDQLKMIDEVFKDLKVDKLLLSNGLYELKGPDGSTVYEISR